jgi:hypothetical protein
MKRRIQDIEGQNPHISKECIGIVDGTLIPFRRSAGLFFRKMRMLIFPTSNAREMECKRPSYL